MSPKYRVLLAVLLSLLAFYGQTVFGQTKVTTKIVHVSGNSIVVKLDNLIHKDCIKGPGAISTSASGGAGQYTFAWKGPGNFSSTQKDISNLQEGLYTLAVTDSKGCSVSRSWNVQSVCAAACSLDDLATVTPVTGCSASNGSISLTITGGSGAYTYTWYNASFQVIANTKNLIAAPVGEYYVEVTDTNTPTCSAFFYYTIESSFKLASAIVPNTSCLPPYTGSITASVTGGSGNYSYAWKYPDGSTVTGGTKLSGLSSGNYQLQIKDNVSGCEITKSLFVYNSSSAVLSITETITPATACSPANGAIDVTVGNGSGNFTYTWINQVTGLSVSTAQDLTQAPPATYSFFVLDNQSKCSASKALTIQNLADLPQYTASVVSNTKCSAPFNGAIDLNLTHAENFEVIWTNGTTTLAQEDLSGLGRGRYGLSLKNKTTGCITTITPESNQAIVVDDDLSESLSVTVDQVNSKTNCSSPDGAIQISIQSNASYTLSWQGPDGFASSQEDIIGLDSGTYVLTAVMHCNAAPVIQTAEVTGELNSMVTIDLFDIISDPDNNLDPESFEILEQPSSGAEASITSAHILQIKYSTVFSGSDNLRLKACDVLQACSENSVTIEVEINEGVIVYNAVAPGSPGDNKFMRIDHLPEGSNHVSIFNRWGDKVFEVDNYENGIPGKRFEGLSNSGKTLPTGTYFYKIEFDKSIQSLTGYLSLKQ
ncbi:MAG TPA: gliding motility-associated C-terminal domain-containing protein [Ohtaekwangia sp.]